MGQEVYEQEDTSPGIKSRPSDGLGALHLLPSQRTLAGQ